MKGARTSILLAVVLNFAIPTFSASAGSGQPKTPPVEGTWLGALKVSSIELRIVFNLRAQADGSLSGTLDSPDQGATGIAITRVGVEKERVTVEVSTIGGRYEGTLNAEGSEMSGKWMQGGAALDLVMKRVKEVPKVVRPQEPKKPYPYLDEEVTYQNIKAGFVLAGTLTMPRTGSPFPAVILITGSGPQDRDESLFGHRPFLVLADYLTRHGIAVLRVDDRGVGGSKGDASQATSEDFAQDVLAGVAYLKTRKEIDPKRIGLAGHSEGGIIAPIAATQSADVAFIVLMAGTGVPGDVIVEKQIANVLKTQGADQAAIDTATRNQRRICEVIRSETDPNAAREKVRKIIKESIAVLSEQQKQALQQSDATVDAQVKGVASKWFRFFITHDPKTVLRRVKCPVLAINGEFDKQVLPQENLPAIEQALREGGNTHFTVKELPGLNHLFQTAKTGNMDEYAKIEETMSPMALETIAKWIEGQTKQK
ncbi:MAG: alpha/beta fold hydrolase [Phycisphaerae bacterium]|nr:alpha/beta fold hydrolase [Phycisphaerae bacterium]